MRRPTSPLWQRSARADPQSWQALICEVTGDGVYDRAFYQPGALELVPCGVEMTEKTGDTVTLYAGAYVHAVELEGEAVFEDNYFSLLPGESRTVSYRLTGTGPLTVQGYTLQSIQPVQQ